MRYLNLAGYNMWTPHRLMNITWINMQIYPQKKNKTKQIKTFDINMFKKLVQMIYESCMS